MRRLFVNNYLTKKRLLIVSSIIGIIGLCLGGLIALAYAEGVFHDPGGQLNNPFKLACDSGTLADRQVTISEDGEYNWMLVKDQLLNVQARLITIQNNSIMFYLVSWAAGKGKGVMQETQLRTDLDLVDWQLLIAHSGHWQLEMVNHSGIPVTIYLHVTAGPSGSLGLLNCINPGDLFRNEG